jgi:fucose permease
MAAPELPIRRSIRRDRATWVAYGLLTVFTYFLVLVGPLLPHLRAELDLSYGEGALHTSAFAAGMILCGLIGDRLVVRLGRSGAAALALAGLAIGILLVAAAPSLAVSVSGCAVMGVVGTLLLVIVPAVLAERHGPARGLAFVEANVLSYVGALLAPVTVWAVVQVASWRLVALPACLILLVSALALRSVDFSSKETGTHHAGGALPPAFWVAWLLLATVVAAEFCVVVWSPTYLETVLGLDRENAVLAASIFAVGMISGRVAGALLLRSWGEEQVIVPSLLVAIGGFLLFWLSGQPVLALAGLFATGLGMANLYAVGLAIALEHAGHASDAATARAALASGSAIIAAPLALGLLADALGMSAAYGLVPVLLLVGLGSVAILHWLPAEGSLER